MYVFFLFFLSGDITEEELLNRLHQIRDGPEQPNGSGGSGGSSSSNSPDVSSGESRGVWLFIF